MNAKIVDECISFAKFLVDRFVDDDCQNTAASLTYQTLFAVVPFLTVLYTVLSAFDAFQGMGATFTDFIFANVIPENVGTVQDYLQEFSTQARSLTVPSGLFLAITVFLMLFTIERTFNDIWRINPRAGLNRLLMYWALLTLCPLLLVVGIGTTTYVLSLPLISDVSEMPFLLQLVPVFVSACVCTLIYYAVPNTNVPFRHAVLGGLLVAVVFEVAKLGFSYVMAQSSFQVIYGAFAVVPLFLLWIYLSWTIVLVGAELVKGLGVYRFGGRDRIEEPFFQILLILRLFFEAHKLGNVVTEPQIRDYSPRVDLEHWPQFRQQLFELNLIRSVDGGMILARDLGELTLWQLYERMSWPLPRRIKRHSGWETQLTDMFKEIQSDNKQRLQLRLEDVFNTAADEDKEPDTDDTGRAAGGLHSA